MINLADVVVTTAEKRPPRVVLYGQPGIGKTTFAAHCPRPLLICVEDGAANIAVPKLYCRSWLEFIAAIKALAAQPHDYKTIAIDTIDRLESIIFTEVCASQKVKVSNIEDIGYAKGYIFALRYWDELLRELDALRDRGIMPLLIAHSVIKSFSPPDSDPYDRYRLNLHDKAAARVMEWADAVLFAKADVTVIKDGQKTRAAATERKLYTEERPSHWGKNRYGLQYEHEFSLDIAKKLITQIMTGGTNASN